MPLARASPAEKGLHGVHPFRRIRFTRYPLLSYDLQNPQEAWDIRSTDRAFTEFLASRGYTVAGGEVHDGTGWSSWKNRTDRVLESLFPLQ